MQALGARRHQNANHRDDLHDENRRHANIHRRVPKGGRAVQTFAVPVAKFDRHQPHTQGRGALRERQEAVHKTDRQHEESKEKYCCEGCKWNREQADGENKNTIDDPGKKPFHRHAGIEVTLCVGVGQAPMWIGIRHDSLSIEGKNAVVREADHGVGKGLGVLRFRRFWLAGTIFHKLIELGFVFGVAQALQEGLEAVLFFFQTTQCLCFICIKRAVP